MHTCVHFFDLTWICHLRNNEKKRKRETWGATLQFEKTGVSCRGTNSMARYLLRIGCGLACSLMSATLILCVIGTASSQMYGAYGALEENKMVGEKWFLYKLMATADDTTRSQHYRSRDSLPCAAMFDRYIAAFVFAILSCIASAAGAVLSGVCAWKAGARPLTLTSRSSGHSNKRKGSSLANEESSRVKLLAYSTAPSSSITPSFTLGSSVRLSTIMFWTIVANFIFLTLAWTLSESVRTMRGCAGRRYSAAEAGYRADYGIALLIAAWCFNGATVAIASVFLPR